MLTDEARKQAAQLLGEHIHDPESVCPRCDYGEAVARVLAEKDAKLAEAERERDEWKRKYEQYHWMLGVGPNLRVASVEADLAAIRKELKDADELIDSLGRDLGA